MKKIFLKRIQLNGFRSLNLDVSFNDGTTKISALNGVGKSSLQSAWNWLLTGVCNADEPKNFRLFDDKQEITKDTPMISVKAWVDINGLEYTIEKSAKPKFTRKRGSDEYIKDSSDTYVIKVDDIAMSATEYNEWLESRIVDVQILDYCLDGSFFKTLAEEDKKQARDILEVIVSNIEPSDFSGDYTLISSSLAKGYDIEQILNAAKDEIKYTNEHNAKISSDIESKEKILLDYSNVDFDAILDGINKVKKDIKDIDEQILTCGIDKDIAQKINSKALKLSALTTIHTAAYNTFKSEINGNIDGIKIQITHTDTNICAFQNKIWFTDKCLIDVEEKIDSIQLELNNTLEQVKEVKAKVFSTTCELCGQEMPNSMLEEGRKTFNLWKVETLDKLNEKAKALKDNLDVEKRRHSSLVAERIDAISNLEESKDIKKRLECELADQKDQLDKLESGFEPVEDTSEYKTLVKEIDELKELARKDSNKDVLTEKKDDLISRLEELNRQYGIKTKRDELAVEINNLKKVYKEQCIALASCEAKLNQCHEYMEERANIISRKINGNLKDCKIQMWELLKNGERMPSCTIMDKNGVRYRTTNTANKIKINVSLQMLFCNKMDIQMPVWIDEASVFSPSNEPKLNGQVIMLYPSDDKTLKVE